MINAHRVVYDNLSSEEFDMIPYAFFNSDDGLVSSFLNREGVYAEHYDGHRTIHRAKHNEVFTPRFTLIKKDFSDIEPSENRRILSWLTSSEKPGWFEVYKDDSNVVEWKVFGYVSSLEQYKLGNGRVVGYEFEVESSHPYAWSRKFVYPEVYNTITEINDNDETNDYLAVSGIADFDLVCNSDEYNKPLYPKVTITFIGKNPYLPIDNNPTKDNTYHMIPNVIYCWKDADGAKHLYVNLNNETDKGVYEIEEIEGKPPIVTTDNSTAWDDYKYYYFPDDGDYIEKLVAVKQDDGTSTYQWQVVAKASMAVKISNTHTPFIGDATTTQETIIAGGTMGETIVLDGMNKIIASTQSTSPRIIDEDFNWQWVTLFTGNNKIAVTGQCQIKFEWLEPRKVGSL
jgi:hypothetical protein